MPTVAQQTAGQTLSGATVEQYTLMNSAGLEAKVLTCGAMLTSVKVPDRSGALRLRHVVPRRPGRLPPPPSVLAPSSGGLPIALPGPGSF